MKLNWKYLAIGAAALLLIALVILAVILGRGGEESGPKVVGVFMNNDQTEQEKKTATLLTEQLEQNGFAVKLYNAQDDQSRQNQQVAEFLQQDCEALLLCPVMPDSTAELLLQAKEKNVPILFFGREPAKEILDQWEKTAYVGCDPAQTGKLQGQILLAQPQKCDVNGDGSISYILLRDSEECADTDLRATGAVETLKAEMAVAELSNTCPGDSKDAARALCENLLANYGKDIEAVICTNDTLALGALEAIEDGGRTVGADIHLVGIGGLEKTLDQIKEGKICGTIMCDVEAQAQKLVELTQTLTQQNPEQKEYYVNHIVITEENIESYIK